MPIAVAVIATTATFSLGELWWYFAMIYGTLIIPDLWDRQESTWRREHWKKDSPRSQKFGEGEQPFLNFRGSSLDWKTWRLTDSKKWEGTTRAVHPSLDARLGLLLALILVSRKVGPVNPDSVQWRGWSKTLANCVFTYAAIIRRCLRLRMFGWTAIFQSRRVCPSNWDGETRKATSLYYREKQLRTVW